MTDLTDLPEIVDPADQATNMRRPTIPLPDYMAECDCPGKPSKHLGTCEAAIRYEQEEKDRPTIFGQHYAGWSIQLPLAIKVEVSANIELDPAAYIRAHLSDYMAFVDEEHHGDRFTAYLCHVIGEESYFDVPGGSSRDRVIQSHTEDPQIDPWDAFRLRTAKWDSVKWDNERTLALHAELGLNEAGDAELNPTKYDDPDEPLLFEEFRRNRPEPELTPAQKLYKAARQLVELWAADDGALPRALGITDPGTVDEVEASALAEAVKAIQEALVA